MTESDVVVKGASDFDELNEEIQNIPTLKTTDIIEKSLNPYLPDETDQHARQIY